VEQAQSEVEAIVTFCITHKAVLIPLLVLVLQQVASLINGNKKFAFESSIIGFILDRISTAPRADSPGSYKLPGVASKPPVCSPPAVVAVVPGPVPIGKITALALVALALHTSACASVSFTQPVFYAGPTVAPIEEISKAHPVPAAAAGIQETIGIGQYAMLDHTWDMLDLSALELGGVALPGSNPVGQFQIGGEIGTLNGVIGLGILSTPYAADGSGFAQGGHPGTTFAAMFNVQAIVADFAALAAKKEDLAVPAIPRLPRGGL
jgi:hypothetical protein